MVLSPGRPCCFPFFSQGARDQPPGNWEPSELGAALLHSLLTCQKRHPVSPFTHPTDIPLSFARHRSQPWGPNREQSRRPRGAPMPWAAVPRASPGLGRAHPRPGAPPRLTSIPFCARRGDWLLSFVYRTSSVQLRVAGLQPVMLQDRRVENVDLSSVVSTACPS